MAAALKVKATFAKSLSERLGTLGCPYTETADEAWIVQLVFTPGEQRIRLLQWLFSKFDSKIAHLLDDSQSVTGSKMDSRIQKLLFIASSLGLCRYDDVDLIRGCESNAISFKKQENFIDALLDIICINDAAEDPMTKSIRLPGVINDACTLADQSAADCRLMDMLATSQLPNTMLRPTVDLIPPDIQRLIHESGKDKNSDPPSLNKMKDLRVEREKQLERRLDVLEDLPPAPEQPAYELQHASDMLELILNESNQLVLSFSYCFENEMHPWCNKAPPALSQLGPAIRRVHTLLEQFAQLVKDLHQIRQSCQKLGKGIKGPSSITPAVNEELAGVFAGIGEEVSSTFQECMDILDMSVRNELGTATASASTSSTSTLNATMTSLCSSTLQI